jgi:DNA-binding FadR family transcriptional regulator
MRGGGAPSRRQEAGEALFVDRLGGLAGSDCRGAEKGQPPEEATLISPGRRNGSAEDGGSSSWPGLGLERPRSAHDQMLRVLALEIMDGVYDVTGFPSETALLHRFQVSRSFLREVIRGLTAKGFLSVKTRVGATVRRAEHWSHFDRDVLRWRLGAGENPVFGEDLRAMCLGLECEAARRAAKRRSIDDLETLQQCLNDLAAEPSDAGARALQRAFRLTICAASDRPVMRSLSGLIEAQLLFDARRGHGSAAARFRAMRRVFCAIRDGDEVTAAAAMRDVIG